ncbi:hypothetical protein ODJ79_16330 [Actinoplanes sp. KI2]|uniref:hypothetical protein n=1 Tax=Actinoplanes sp. KI2 TaxID=2983315 RepID=UPI0021D5F4D3|nr:hypothetical protein [Actinoplanes sp. KI2]MCU7725296.1 hypothetical protein [Actinoplanes sp. KI2]
MRRTFAVALAVGVLLLGGCDRQHAQSSGGPAVGGAPAATHGTAATSGKSTNTGTGATSAGGRATANDTHDVNSMLDDVDKQLSSDSQPTKDSD